MREEMASSLWLCVCVFVCVHALWPAQITALITTVPARCNGNKLFPFLSRRRPVILRHYLGTLDETSRPK